MGQRAWVLRTKATVGAHPASVAAWYMAPERWEEQALAIRKQGVTEVTERLWESDGKRIRELTWTCRHGKRGSLRFETVLGTEGVLLPIDKGFQVQREQISVTHGPRGRELLAKYKSLFEFRGFRGADGSLVDLTEVAAVHHQTVTGGPWWEQLLPPVTARVQATRRAEEMARRCEAELVGGA